jgi:hypothetical protein
MRPDTIFMTKTTIFSNRTDMIVSWEEFTYTGPSGQDTLYEVFRDEDAPKMTETMCSEINHQKYYSGEFDIEWGQTITEKHNDFKREEMLHFKQWLASNSYDWEDPTLSLGYIKLGQVDIARAFGQDADIGVVHEIMTNNLNIKSIKILKENTIGCDYPYTLDSDDWRQIQIEGLKRGYESRSVR